MPEKVLYVSAGHSVLEYDDLKIINELGYDWFSTGVYQNPRMPIGGSLRPKFNLPPKPQLVAQFHAIHPHNSKYRLEYEPLFLNKKFVDQFDVVVLSSPVPYPFYLRDNWEALKHKPILIRMFAQCMPQMEELLRQYKSSSNMKIIRMSSKEKLVPLYAGEDFIIRHYADENIFHNWNGNDKHVLTFNNHLKHREEVSNLPIYRRIIKNVPYKLYGKYNEGVEYCSGVLDDQEQLSAYQNSRCYFALGTKPAPVTYNFVEALMTGCPVVTWGPKLGGSNPPMYEVPDLIENEKEGFWSDSEKEISKYLNMLLNDSSLATSISKAGREKALKYFSKTAATIVWKEAFDSLK